MDNFTPGLLNKDYRDKIYEKWKDVVNAGPAIKDEYVKVCTALVLENTQKEHDHSVKTNRMMTESYFGGDISQTGAFGAAPGTAAGGGALGSTFDYGTNDARMPSIVIPTARRIFPELLAHEVAGVQPMSGPVGFAFALRYLYGTNGKGGASGATSGTEMGYNYLDSQFTGASGNAGSGDFWDVFAGTNTYGDAGQAESLTNSEWWNIGEDMPMAQLKMEKSIVEAKTRKLAAQWSQELAEDMMNMHGIDIDTEMVDVTSYEIKAEIDRQLLTEMVKSAITGGKTSTWSPVSADGRNQEERIAALYQHLLQKSQEIAINTRRGPATFAIASPVICGLFERLIARGGNAGDYSAISNVSTNNIGVAKVGLLRNGTISLYRDTFAGGNYILLGYKGPTPYDAGIIYTPYIPVQLMRAVGQENFSPRIGVRTRYGILGNLFGSENYFQFIKVDGLTSSALSNEQRVFLYS